ncbi:hypothetical protein [Peribacillus butanolivorans]|uniref:hypothetical protein n=1 Tax=Peribacillus butanolivorans TaxID=421767 RepID=UPI00365EE419
MSEKITAKVLKKEKEKVEKLMSVFGTTTYNDWLHQQHENYINENNEKALEELLKMKEKFTKQDTPLEEKKTLEDYTEVDEKVEVKEEAKQYKI